jgi:hypothetical protein
MTIQSAGFGYRSIRFLSVAGWLTVALALGCVAALAGPPFLYGFIGLGLLVIFGFVANLYPSAVMATSVWALALCPFSLGIETGVLPKLFADEILLLSYIVVLLPMYMVTARTWQSGAGKYLWIVAGFVLCQCVSLLVRTDLIAFRNILETCVLGSLLLVVFLQEAANTEDGEWFSNAVVWLTVLIAILSIVERVLQRNPILERMELEGGFQYLSPQIVAITEGVYRPYVTFFHPSETGTFMAMGLPYAIRGWMRQRHWFAAIQILLIAGGLGVNATRGVWVGVALSLLLLARNPIMIIVSAIPAAGLGGFFAYLALKSTPFMQRLSDSNNLLGRFIYWQLGAEVFSDNRILGVGHMQFEKVYLDYVHTQSEIAQISITQIHVIDNVYLTTLAEHGIVGFVGLAALFISTWILLTRLRKKLLDLDLVRQASLVQATQMVLVAYAVSGFFADVNEFTKATKLFFILVGFGIGTAMQALRTNEDRKEKVAARAFLKQEPVR